MRDTFIKNGFLRKKHQSIDLHRKNITILGWKTDTDSQTTVCQNCTHKVMKLISADLLLLKLK